MLTIEKNKNRIAELRDRYILETPKISIQRAKYYTESWKKTEGSGLTAGERVALAMKNVYENMDMHVEPEDLIAGYWTEDFMGIPIDIERGVFNGVFKTELARGSIMRFRFKSLGGALSYLVGKRGLRDFARNMKASRAAGQQPMNLEIKTMDEREINRYVIDPEDRKVLVNELLPFWEGKTVVEEVDRRLMSSGLLGEDMREFSLALPTITSRQTMMVSICSTISSYQGHVIIDFDTVVKKGLLKMKEEAAQRIAAAADDETRAFHRSVEMALDGAIVFARRLADAVKAALEDELVPECRVALRAALENCKTAPLMPSETFMQAVQAAWTVKTAVELAHPVNLHSFGRMDQIFYPYYKKDIEDGIITRDEARAALEELLLKIMSQNIRPESNMLSNFYHRFLGSSPVTVGGVKPDGTDGTNELTYLFLEAAARAKAVTNVSLRVHKDSPEDLLPAAAEAVFTGGSNISLFNDDINVESMRRRGFSDEDARDYAVMGCVEMLCPGKTGGMSASALLLSRLLDLTLRNGNSLTMMGLIKNVGLKTGEPESFDSYESFEEAFLKQARHQIKLIADASNIKDDVFADMLPAPLISAFMQGCAEKGRDVVKGGALYDLSGISFINSIANVSDSLLVIKKLVFEKRKFALREIIEAINVNYAGLEDLRREIAGIEGKWGNGFAETDELARRVTNAMFDETYKYSTSRGGVFVPYVISMTTHTIDGRLSIATPDGRRAATPYAASCNPYNVEKNGVTAAMRSVASLDFTQILGAAVNMKFHPSAVGGTQEARKKWAALIRAYFRMGGAQLQPTVVSSETMREAQQDPDAHRDLIVKVGGYSAYFTELGREIQDEVIARTEQYIA
ncbi:MAG: 4-hydroxyphenylacetate decarboxylase large subunit [bacterium ADurb.Bin236]|nr:MAG: 4-hydroxyphenylacetate decarboxylase large subunit [bacterium ADurb.Bin236]HOY62956.1 pyruvate formate lyase family protein [bacterium]